ncbi:hypothetical protein Leryth_007642 [Lithospermum erythrorhizon]|nr:hypothetical protein Leryth_007642 [Lithospermum erythrorhizon]
MGELEPKSGVNFLKKEGVNPLLSGEEKVKEAFKDDHSKLAADLYTRSFAPKQYAVSGLVHNPTEGSNSSTQTRDGDTLNLATKEEGGVFEIVKKVAVVAGVALVGWGISKLLGEDPSSERERKTMKAPGNDYRIIRDVFESNAKGYFKGEREKKKMARKL